MIMRVMIVDDSTQVRRMIKSFLGDLVTEFVECADGSEAVSAFAAHQPDLVLMDYEMTRMNGFDATKEIKRQFPAARVVIVSQWDSPALREAAEASGADAYVNKKSLLPLRDFIRYGPVLFRTRDREGT
jgi:CheY-like chemotaxis protein